MWPSESAPGASASGHALGSELADLAEPLVMAWSSMPPDLPERLSASQLRALTALRRHGEMTVSQLAGALGALPSSVTRICDRLVAAGHIERAPERSNRRFHTISLTEPGLRLLEALDRHRTSALLTVLERMPIRARSALLEGLTGFAEQADDGRERPGDDLPGTSRERFGGIAPA